MSIAYRDIIKLEAPPEVIRQFVMTPERILDYYPGGIEGGVIEPGAAIFVRASSGVSLLQLDQVASTPMKLVVEVYTAGKLEPPYTADRIRAAAFFSMVEDWCLEPHNGGTLLTKTWRDIRKYRMRFLPMKMLVVRGAKSESQALREGWDRAASEMSPD